MRVLPAPRLLQTHGPPSMKQQATALAVFWKVKTTPRSRRPSPFWSAAPEHDSANFEDRTRTSDHTLETV